MNLIETKKLFTVLALTTVLYGCAGGSVNKDGLIIVTADSEARLATEAHKAIAEGTADKALKTYSRLYHRASSRNDKVVLNYAQLLRNDKEPEAAMDAIYDYAFTRDEDIKAHVSAAVINELVAIKVEIGDFKAAEKLAERVINNPDAADFYADAHNLLGVALDAEGKHRTAEVHFRKAMETWKGDVTSVKNNLAVCLASQGRFDEALMHLRQALIEAPEKEEIVKNIELINIIRESIIPKAPVR